MLYIVTNPLIYNALLVELKSSQISNPTTDAEARQLPYLQAIIREGLRMFPPATSLLFRTVPPGGDTLCGYFVPQGTNIGSNIVALTRNSTLWGPDAKVFRPERWLNRSAGERKQMDDNIELGFGHWKWKCWGMNTAQIELNKVFVQVCRPVHLLLEPQLTQTLSC